LSVRERHHQFPWAELWHLQGKFDDPIPDLLRDAVPHPAGPWTTILERFDAASQETVIPSMEGGTRYTERFQRATRRQVGSLDNLDDLELLGGGVDTYDVDRIEVTSRGGKEVAIKKFYHFASNLDVQLFLDVPDLSFVENSGRGDIAYGHCTVVK
jgi:hypothetical protein